MPIRFRLGAAMLCIPLAGVSALSRAATVPAPVQEFRFNETGSTTPSTGTDKSSLTLRSNAGAATDLHSADALGVSGLAGDRAFNNSASSSMGSPGPGGRADQNDNNNIDAFKSFTLQGWFKTDGTEVITNAARIIDNTSTAAGYLLLGTNGKPTNAATGAPGELQLNVNNANVVSQNWYNDAGSWVYFAVSYDGTLAAGNVNFYKGTIGSPVTLEETLSLATGSVADDTNGVTVGGRTGLNDRPFDGFLDDLRIFGSKTDDSGVLSLGQLEQVRQADILNQAINVPEPGTLWLLALGTAALLARRRNP